MRTIDRDAAAIGISTGVYGVAFGAAGIAAGLGTLPTCLLSLAAFTGGSQFAAVGVVGAGGTALAAISSALLLGARNALYGLRLAPLLRVRGARRALAAHGVIDETTAMAVAHPDDSRRAFSATFIAVFTCWNLGTLLGAVGAEALGDPARFGLDAMAPAAFLALLAPRLRASSTAQLIALGGAAIAVVTTPFLPVGAPILCAAAAVILGVRR